MTGVLRLFGEGVAGDEGALPELAMAVGKMHATRHDTDRHSRPRSLFTV